MVLLNVNIQTAGENDTLNGRVIIGTLPEGYRPDKVCVTSAFARKRDNSKAYVADAWIASDGIIVCSIFGADDFAGIIHFQCLFSAGAI